MTISYTHNGQEFVLEECENGMYSINQIKDDTKIKTYKVMLNNFKRSNNGAWVGTYKSSKGSKGKTLGSTDFTVAFLQYIGCTLILVNGGEVRIQKAARAEIEFGAKLMKAMGEVYEVIPQFSVLNGKYFIDFYIPETRQAFEYDERQHFTEERLIADAIRQREIEEVLGCTFIRIPH